MDGIYRWIGMLVILLSLVTQADNNDSNTITTSKLFDSLEGAYLAANSTAILLAYSMHTIDTVDAAIIHSSIDCFTTGYEEQVSLAITSAFSINSMAGERFTAQSCNSISDSAFTGSHEVTYLDGRRFYAMQNDVELITLSGHSEVPEANSHFTYSHRGANGYWHSESRGVLAVCNHCENDDAVQLQLYVESYYRSNGWSLDFTLGKKTSMPLIIKEVANHFRSNTVEIHGGFSARIHHDPACQFAVKDFQTMKVPTIIGDAHAEWSSDKSYPEKVVSGEVAITFDNDGHYFIAYQQDGGVTVNNQRLDEQKLSTLKQRCDFLEGLNVEVE